jgi:phosphate/sulfate permease
MAAPAIVLEGHGVFAGLRRSFALTKGAAFWRILGISLLAGFFAGIAAWVLGLPFSVIGAIIQLSAGQDVETGQMGATFVSHLSALLTGAITTPFVAAVTGLLYIDRRMRLEALDVVLLREAQNNPAPRI